MGSILNILNSRSVAIVMGLWYTYQSSKNKNRYYWYFLVILKKIDKLFLWHFSRWYMCWYCWYYAQPEIFKKFPFFVQTSNWNKQDWRKPDQNFDQLPGDGTLKNKLNNLDKYLFAAWTNTFLQLWLFLQIIDF